MRMNEALGHYGTKKAIAKALGLQPSAVTMWEKYWGPMVPRPYAAMLSIYSGGKLTYDDRAYMRLRIVRPGLPVKFKGQAAPRTTRTKRAAAKQESSRG